MVNDLEVQEVDESVGLTGSKNGMLQSKVVADPSSPLVGTSSGKAKGGVVYGQNGVDLSFSPCFAC